MNICITSTGPSLESLIDSRFGRAQYFILLDENGKLKESLSNFGGMSRRGAGIAAAQQIADRGAGILITGNIGPNASFALKAAGVKVFLASPNITVEEAFSLWKNDKLEQVRIPSVPGHFGRGDRRGPRR